MSGAPNATSHATIRAAIEDFVYVDTAIGTEAARNKIKDITTWKPSLDQPVYATYVRCPVALREWRNTHKNDNGNPTVAEYDGPAWTDCIPFDFDAKGDLSTAVRDARELVNHLSQTYGVGPATLPYWYSGGRSIHIELPTSLMGGIDPMPIGALCARLKAFVEALGVKERCPTLDMSMYDRMRLWRVEGSRHHKGRYKVPITLQEFRDLDPDAIQALGAVRRTVPQPGRDWAVNGKLAVMWQATAPTSAAPSTASRNGTTPGAGADADTPTKQRRPGDLTTPTIEEAVEELANAWPDEGDGVHAAGLALAGGLAGGTHWDADTITAFVEMVVLKALGEDGQRRIKTHEFQRGVKDTVRKHGERGKKTTGWTTLGGTIGEDVVTRVRDLVEPRARLKIKGLDDDDGPGNDSDSVAGVTPSDPPPDPRTLAEVIATFHRWLYLEDDGLIYAMLGALAANYAEGDPVWLLLVGGSSSGKTEPIVASGGLPRTHLAATITESGLLSGSPKRDRDRASTGGLLRDVGEFGVLLLKDFTSILSMNRDARATLLAALREIFDGSWQRRVGTDGGRTLEWSGKLGLIAGCTTAIDSHHAVMATMGERFLLFRLSPVDPLKQARQALKNAKRERVMRQELRDAVSGLFAGLSLDGETPAASEQEIDQLVALATLAARCRSAVDRDGRTREVELIHDAEAPARIAGTLLRLYGGMLAIGADQTTAWSVIVKVGLDCLPKLRRNAFEALRTASDWMTTADIAVKMFHPTLTARRALEELVAHGIVERRSGAAAPTSEQSKKAAGRPADKWRLSPWARGLLASVFISEMSEGISPESADGGDSTNTNTGKEDKSDKYSPSLWTEHDQGEDDGRQAGCWRCKAGVAEDSDTTCDACGWLECAECGACAEHCSGAVTDEQAACPACAGPGSSRADGVCYACAVGGTA